MGTKNGVDSGVRPGLARFVGGWVVALAFLSWLLKSILSRTVYDREGAFWFYAASSQSLAALAAFLVAAAAIFFKRVDDDGSPDDPELNQVRHEVGLDNFARIRFIAWVLGFAALVSLAGILVNGSTQDLPIVSNGKTWYLFYTLLVAASAILLTLKTSVEILDPGNAPRRARIDLARAMDEDRRAPQESPRSEERKRQPVAVREPEPPAPLAAPGSRSEYKPEAMPTEDRAPSATDSEPPTREGRVALDQAGRILQIVLLILLGLVGIGTLFFIMSATFRGASLMDSAVRLLTLIVTVFSAWIAYRSYGDTTKPSKRQQELEALSRDAVPVELYFRDIRRLEDVMAERLNRVEVPVEDRHRASAQERFRHLVGQLLDTLPANERDYLEEALLRVAHVRALVAHGRVSTVPRTAVDEVRRLVQMLTEAEDTQGLQGV